jgi:hypothetical protein
MKRFVCLSAFATLLCLAQSIDLVPNYHLGPTEQVFKLKMQTEDSLRNVVKKIKSDG